MNNLEHAEQVALVHWFRWQYPQYLMFANENGAHLAGDAKQRAGKMARMKQAGHVNGVADLFLMHPSKGFNGLFIEMKSPKGLLSDAQAHFLAKACSEGYAAEYCRGFDEAKKVIESYLNA